MTTFSDDGNGPEKDRNFSEAVDSYLQEEGEESFAEMLEAYDAGENQDLRVGDVVKGSVISIGRDSVFVDTGTKIDGTVDRAELLDENGELTCSTGDVLELYVVVANESEIRLSRALSGIGGLNLLRDAWAGRVPVEGKIREACKGGFHVDIMQKRAFCPISQVDVNYVENPEDYIGNTYSFIITAFEEGGRNIVVSRRKLLSQKIEAEKKVFIDKLSVGDVHEARITNIMKYGAFAELFPGVEGMIHVSELTWSRLEKPEDAVRKDEKIKVKVIGIEEGEKPGQVKISLSAKQIDEDPWSSFAARFREGDRVRGRVTRCAPFGAFVEIVPGVEGLVHISEMSYRKRVLKPEEIVTPGEETDILIKEIDPVRKRISLSIKDAEGDPWIGAADRYEPGKKVEGVIEKKEKFGWFITLESGVTGLLPRSKVSQTEHAQKLETMKVGAAVEVVVAEINTAERKITLGVEGGSDGDDWRSYAGKKTGGGSMGSLGEQLQEALRKSGKG